MSDLHEPPKGYPPSLLSGSKGRSLAQREADAAEALALLVAKAPSDAAEAIRALGEEVADATRLRTIIATARLMVLNHLDLDTRGARLVLMALDNATVAEMAEVIGR